MNRHKPRPKGKNMDDLKKLVKQLSKAVEARDTDRNAPQPFRKGWGPGTAVPRDPKKLAQQEHTCPKCGFTALIGEEFGLRTDKYGRPKFQSWCRSCRSSKEAHPGRHGLARTYRNR
jgi:hypothetical protein